MVDGSACSPRPKYRGERPSDQASELGTRGNSSDWKCRGDSPQNVFALSLAR